MWTVGAWNGIGREGGVNMYYSGQVECRLSFMARGDRSILGKGIFEVEVLHSIGWESTLVWTVK